MSLSIGDELQFDGALGRIVAVTDSTDGDGRGFITYEGATFRFRLLKAAAPEVPLVATADPYLRVGLAQRVGDPALFCLVFDDLPAPCGWGRWIQQDGWREASELAAQDAVVFVLGWCPGEITISKGVEPQVGVFADIVLRYTTGDGEQEAWWQPAYPYSDLELDEQGVPLRGPNKLGCFKTNAEGVLKRHDPDGTLGPIIFPRGFGALGQRAQDTWPDAPSPERLLQRAEVWYLQRHVDISEGMSATLDVPEVSITVNGPTDGRVVLWWEDGIRRAGGWLGPSGTQTFEGLPPGRYAVACYHVDNEDLGLPRQEVIVTTGSATVNFPSEFPEADPNLCRGYVYKAGATPAPGATVWIWKPGLPGRWLSTTTDEQGYWEFDATGMSVGPLVVISEYGCAKISTVGGLNGIFWDVAVGGTVGAIVGGQWQPNPNFEEGIFPWGKAGAHCNLPIETGSLFLRSQTTGKRYKFMPGEAGGVVSEPLPKWLISNPWDTPPPDIIYDVCDASGNVITTTTLVGDQQPPWVPLFPQSWQCSAEGRPLNLAVGGKIEGNIVESSRTDRITVANLPEACRMGLEFGRWTQPLEGRAISESTLPTECAPPATFTGWECPYCGGPAWGDPDGEGYVRGFCMQCADFGITTDCRTYFITRTLAVADDWRIKWVRNTTAGGHIACLIPGWPRPEEYDETDDYLVWDWAGLGIPRWVAVHLVFGQWDNRTFTDGESIADAEARLGRTVGPVMLKLELTQDYHGSGQTLVVHCTRSDGQPDSRTVVVPPGACAGDVLPLCWGPHSGYPRGYYVDVTGIEKLAGDGAVYARVVNDGPAWHSGLGVEIAQAVHSPYACDLSFSRRDPFLVEDFAGRLHLVYIREGKVLHRVLESGSTTWSEPVDITGSANWPHPCEEPSLAPLPHAELLASAHSNGATRLWRSRDDGTNWH